MINGGEHPRVREPQGTGKKYKGKSLPTKQTRRLWRAARGHANGALSCQGDRHCSAYPVLFVRAYRRVSAACAESQSAIAPGPSPRGRAGCTAWIRPQASAVAVSMRLADSAM